MLLFTCTGAIKASIEIEGETQTHISKPVCDPASRIGAVDIIPTTSGLMQTQTICKNLI